MELTDFVNILGSWSSGTGPLYRQLAQAMIKAFVQGDVMAGTALPAERQLASVLAVSRSTVVAAYELLRQEEWVESKTGSRTRVRPQPAQRLAGGRETAFLPRTVLARNPFFDSLFDPARPPIDLSAGSPGTLSILDPALFTLSPPEMANLLTERGYNAAGWPELRQAIARHYSEAGLPTVESQIMVTNGAQQAIALLASAYIQRGDHVIIENPSYFGAINALRGVGARLLPLQIESPDGIRPAELRNLIESHMPRLIYLQSNFQNPTGTILSYSQRQAIVDLSAEFNVPVIDDNTLGEIALHGAAPLPLAAVSGDDNAATIITIGSMSKLFWAGLRIGWVRAPEPVINRLSQLKVMQDLGSGVINQVIAARLLKLAPEVKAARRLELQVNLEILSQSLAEWLPDWSWVRPAGGLFLWVKLPVGEAGIFAQVASRCGVTVLPGSIMSVDDRYRDHLRIPFLHDTASLTEAVHRLAQAWEAYQPLTLSGQTPIKVIV